MKFFSNNASVVVVIVLFSLLTTGQIDSAAARNTADSETTETVRQRRLRSSSSSSSSIGGAVVGNRRRVATDETTTPEHHDDEQEEGRNFWARQITADLDSMVTNSPTTSPTSKSNVTVNKLNNEGLIYSDIQNIASYTTFCRTGKYTNVQVVNSIDNNVFCITDFEGAKVRFGYEQDSPDYPLIKLNIEPPKPACGDDDDDEDNNDEDGGKNYCGFRGKENYVPITQIVNSIINDNVVNLDITNVASVTTYCQENQYKNVRAVSVHGTVTCITSKPGGKIYFLKDGDIVEVLNVDPPTSSSGCDIDTDDISSSSGSTTRVVTDSLPCGFNGVATTVYPNFHDNESKSESPSGAPTEWSMSTSHIVNKGTINFNSCDVESCMLTCFTDSFDTTNHYVTLTGYDGSSFIFLTASPNATYVPEGGCTFSGNCGNDIPIDAPFKATCM